MPRRTLFELTVVESTLFNVPVPRRMLVDAEHILSLEDLGDSSPDGARCHVVLSVPDDTIVEDEAGEHVGRRAKSLMTVDTYDELRSKLGTIAEVVPSWHASEEVIAKAIETSRVRPRRD